MLLARSAASRAHLRSHSGHNAGAALAYAQTSPSMLSLLPCFGCSSWKGSNFPSRLTRPCVPFAGNLWTRGGATEPHVVPEGCGNEPRCACWLACAAKWARVRFFAFMRDMNVNIAATDERRIRPRLALFGGVQLAVDVTLRCVLSSTGGTSPEHSRRGWRCARGCSRGQGADLP